MVLRPVQRPAWTAFGPAHQKSHRWWEVKERAVFGLHQWSGTPGRA
ncbi:hypothetical protein NJL88_11380 [Streptomyces sp. DK15]|nr:hypothetical protein [Streptomyces sp. DK15]MDX2390655.1 hypothetical protein [Streptomyces sp. DK15]